MTTKQLSRTHCPVCKGNDSIHLVEIMQVPTHCNLLWPTREHAQAVPRGDVLLAYCPQCGHVYNVTFDPALMAYTQDYENSLHFSPRFQQYATSLATRLVNRYNLYNKDIIEIGSGKGDFLTMLCQLGNNRGVGFDPSHVPGIEGETTVSVTFIQDFYSEKYTDYKADFIGCRHVLEHIQHPGDFVATVRQAVGDRYDTIVFFEVPNVLFTLRDLGIWDIIYEHCSYFSPYSLTWVFHHNGFRVLRVEPTFNGQFLTIEAVPINGILDSWAEDDRDKRQMTSDVAAFGNSYREKVMAWQKRLKQMAATGQQAIVWGAGSKGVTFMNTLGTQDIEYVVDINPRKEGMYVSGTGQKIVSPEFLKTYQPDTVIIMNLNYKEEIGRTLHELGVSAKIVLA